MPALLINFTENASPPSGGYGVRFRKVGTQTYETRTGYSAPPLRVADVDDQTSYEGFVISFCGSTSTETPFSYAYLPPAQALPPCVSMSEETVSNEPMTCSACETCIPEQGVREVRQLRASLPAPYERDLTVQASLLLVDDCGGGGPLTLSILIPAGQLSATASFTASQLVYCSQGGGCFARTASYTGQFTQSPACH